MGDSSVKKLESEHSPHGHLGQKYLASGRTVSMRLFESVAPSRGTYPTTERDYETVGFALSGKARLHIEGQVVELRPGDSWVVPKGSKHAYEVLEPFTAVEATAPPAEIDARDAAAPH